MRTRRNTRSRGKLRLFLALLVTASALAIDPAGATHVICGQTITADTTLDSNVGPCSGNGIVIGADNITLDLNGHRVFGTEQPGEGAGILLDGRSAVQVKNGTVSLFDAGVAILGGNGNSITGIGAVNNVGAGNTDFGDGIVISSSSGNVVSGSRIVDNGPFSGVAIFGAESSGNTVDSNFIVGNDAVDATDPNHGDPSGTQQTDGVRLEPRTSRNTVSNNIIRGSGLDGIAIFAFSTDNTVRGNDVRGNGLHDKTHRKGSGIILFNGADRNVVEANTVIGNAANGIVLRGALLRPAPRPPIPGAQFNRVLNNTTRGNGVFEDPETDFFDLRDDNLNPPCDQNEWVGNTYKTYNQLCVTQ